MVVELLIALALVVGFAIGMLVGIKCRGAGAPVVKPPPEQPEMVEVGPPPERVHDSYFEDGVPPLQDMPAHRGSPTHRARVQGLPAREGIRGLAPAPEDDVRARPLREVRASVRSFRLNC